MAKKVKPGIVYVKCRNCKNASDFGDNSAYCKAKGIECVPVTDMGKYAIVFKRNNYNEIGENYEYRDADKDT